jgi:hypothetical protein
LQENRILETMDQLPDQAAPLEQSSHIDESRRRRTRRLIIPSGKTERTFYINEFAKRLTPGLDFYLFSALCGVVLGVAILFDHPALYILAALLAPFMAPLIGLGFSTAIGAFKFFVQSLGSLLIGSAFIFICGLLSGWISKLIPGFIVSQVNFHTSFSIPDLILLLVGTILAVYLTVRVPKQRSLVASVALAYEVFLPIGVAGFGLTSGMHGIFGSSLKFAGINILLVILIGGIVLAFMHLKPFTLFGYLLTAVLIGGTLYALLLSSAINTSLQLHEGTFTQTPTWKNTEAAFPNINGTPTPNTPTIPVPMNGTATNTLVPTRTPTITLTPKPAEVWATIDIEVGVYIRQNPCADEVTCPRNGSAVPNNTVVQVLAFSEDNNWVQVRLYDGREGWVHRTYLSFDTQSTDGN